MPQANQSIVRPLGVVGDHRPFCSLIPLASAKWDGSSRSFKRVTSRQLSSDQKPSRQPPWSGPQKSSSLCSGPLSSEGNSAMGYGTRCRNRLGRHIFGPIVSSRWSGLLIGIEPYYTKPGLVGSRRRGEIPGRSRVNGRPDQALWGDGASCQRGQRPILRRLPRHTRRRPRAVVFLEHFKELPDARRKRGKTPGKR